MKTLNVINKLWEEVLDGENFDDAVEAMKAALSECSLEGLKLKYDVQRGWHWAE